MEENKIIKKCPYCGSEVLEGAGMEEGYTITCVSCGKILYDNIENNEDEVPYYIPDTEYTFDDADNLDEEDDDGECEECKLW